MPEPRRFESSADVDADTVARDSQVEALLVDGLDRYFAGRYDEAIHLWSRVLFLDRSHARARAYIERARTALAERQRRADELLQDSHDMLAQGRTDAARDLLSQAVAATGDDERVSALRLRLERVERAHAPMVAGVPAPAAGPEPVPGWSWPRRSPGVLGLATSLAAALMIVVVVGTPAGALWFGLPSAQETLVTPSEATALPVLSSAEVALVRARTLYSRGRLSEALRALDRVGPDSPVRARADELRIEIQRLLLASGREPSRLAAGSIPDSR
jgi:tetratricopeptide (TPR) repeat protein